MFRILKCSVGIVCLALAIRPAEEVVLASSLLTPAPDDFTECLLTTVYGTFDPATVVLMSGAIALVLVLCGLALIVSAAVGGRPTLNT